MIDRRIPPAGDPIHATGKPKRGTGGPGSTRHCRADHAFILLLEEDFGIEAHALNAAFLGVPPTSKRQCIELCEWAIRVTAGDPEGAGNALRAWARKHKAGTYSPKMHDQEPPRFGGREQGGV